MKTDLKLLLENANALVPSCKVEEAKEKVENSDYAFIDVREKHELDSEGKIPGAVHIPRGMLEFMMDESSPYYDTIFGSPKSFIFYCKSGGRSVLAAQRAMEMGLQNVLNMEGGFIAWNKQ